MSLGARAGSEALISLNVLAFLQKGTLVNLIILTTSQKYGYPRYTKHVPIVLTGLLEPLH